MRRRSRWFHGKAALREFITAQGPALVSGERDATNLIDSRELFR